MLCYKTGAHVGQALESIGRQICADCKVLVVDDRSPDDGPRDASIAFARPVTLLTHLIVCVIL
jgi:hypothetical protein